MSFKKRVSLCTIYDDLLGVVKCILYYLKGTITHELLIYSNSCFALHGFLDVDWIGNHDDKQPVSGFAIFFSIEN